jgi:multidrug efflux system outer membrane protein
MNAPTRAIAVAVLLGLSGCVVGPDYERPPQPAPEQYRGVLTPQDAQSMADLQWAAVFRDPELAPLIQQALLQNLDLQIAAARIEEFYARERIARSFLGPTIGLNGVTDAVANQPGEEGPDNRFTMGLRLSWEIDLFGRLRRADEAARTSLLAQEDFARGVMNSLVANVATTWFRLREIDAQIEIIQHTIKIQEDSLALVRSLKKGGVASGTEEQQALSQLASTRAQLPLAIQRRSQYENLLRFLAGDIPGAVARTQPAPPFPALESLPVGLPAQLLARRPDLRQLEHQLHTSTALIGVAEASRFPYLSIGLTSFLGIVSTDLGSLFTGDDPAKSLFSIGPFVSMPIFQSGRGKALVDVAESQAKQSELAYRRGVLQAYREVADALAVTSTSRDFIEQTAVREKAAREVLRLQRLRYKAGVVSYLEILDAERQLFAAEIELVRARLRHVEGYVELYRALGGGWSDEELRRLTKITTPKK